MQNICFHLAYDGTDFFGSQEQVGRRTVLGVLRAGLEKVLDSPVRLIAAGRTDAGVHAEDQVVNFLVRQSWPARAIAAKLAPHLPEDLAILHAEAKAPSFHARFAPHTKTYRYVVDTAPVLLPTRRRTAGHYTYPMNPDLVHEALHLMEGEHDFSGLCVQEPYRTSVRILSSATLTVEGSQWIFRFEGQAFLRQQVRMMTGAALSVGRGVLTLDALKTALSSPQKGPIAFSMPSKGLILENVRYDSL